MLCVQLISVSVGVPDGERNLDESALFIYTTLILPSLHLRVYMYTCLTLLYVTLKNVDVKKPCRDI